MEGTPLYAEDPEEEEKQEKPLKKPENIGFFAVESGSEEPSGLAKAWAETKREPDAETAEAPKPAETDVIPLPGTEIVPDAASAAEVPPPVPAEILPVPEPATEAPAEIIEPAEPAAAEAPDAAEEPATPETPETPVTESEPPQAEAPSEEEIPPVPAELLSESETLPGPAPEAPPEAPPESPAADTSPAETATEEPAEVAAEAAPEAPVEAVTEAETEETPETAPAEAAGEEEAAASKPFEFSEGPGQEEDELPPAPLPEAPLPEPPLPEAPAPEPPLPEAPVAEPEPPQPETPPAEEVRAEAGAEDDTETDEAPKAEAEQPAAEDRDEERGQEEPDRVEAVQSYAPSAEAAVVPEETRSSRAAEERMAVETAPKGPLAGRRVETLGQAELLDIASEVNIDGSNLRHIYETHMIGERGLRRLIEEYENGGDMREALKREMLEHQIDFERDPAMRDLAPQGHPADDHGDDAGDQLIDRLLENSGAAGHPDEKSLASQQDRYRPDDGQAWQGGRHGRSRAALDALFIAVISILLLLVIFVYLSRH